jgi:hypothetical protein
VTVPKPDRDEEYRQELLGYFQRAMDRHNLRNQQQMLGPSEIGGCLRGIAWKLYHGAADGKRQGWASHKGTLLHEWADEKVFDPEERFLSNLKLPQVVPWVDGGTLDLYDRPKKTIIDFKFPGDASMEKARRGKPSDAYYGQVNAYGIGAIKAGLEVERVALLVPPMCGDDLHSEAKGAVLLTWPFDPQAAVEHYKDVKRVQDMRDSGMPLLEAMAALPTKEDFCISRPCWRANGGPCAGHRKGNGKMANPDNPFDV